MNVQRFFFGCSCCKNNRFIIEYANCSSSTQTHTRAHTCAQLPSLGKGKLIKHGFGFSRNKKFIGEKIWSWIIKAYNRHRRVAKKKNTCFIGFYYTEPDDEPTLWHGSHWSFSHFYSALYNNMGKIVSDIRSFVSNKRRESNKKNCRYSVFFCYYSCIHHTFKKLRFI